MTFTQKLCLDVARAIVMLSRIPTPHNWTTAEDRPWPYAVWSYPLVGLVTGGGVWVAAWAGHALNLPSFATGFLAVVVGLMITGGLHADGLADTADGFGGGHTKDRKLDIMKDSHIGAYGVMALICVLGLQAAAYAHMSSSLELSFNMMIGAAVASRAAMVMPILLLRPARDDGLGHSISSTPNVALIRAALIGAGALVLLLPIGKALGALIIVCCLLGAWVWTCHHHIGGYTGDTLGTTQILVETILLLYFVSIFV